MRLIITFSIIALLTVVSAEASPRKTGSFNFPRNEEDAPKADVTLQQDATAQKDAEAAKAIKLESESGPRLTERREGETFLEYRERLEADRERLKNTKLTDEELKEAQLEALYEAEYQLRKKTFPVDQSAAMFGQGAGPSGDRYQAPLELQRVMRLLEAQKEEEAAAAAVQSNGSDKKNEAAVQTDQEREEGTPEPQ